MSAGTPFERTAAEAVARRAAEKAVPDEWTDDPSRTADADAYLAARVTELVSPVGDTAASVNGSGAHVAEPFAGAIPDGERNTALAAISWQRLSNVELRSIVFIDKPLWQADAFHLVAGRKGQGKGTLLALEAAAVTRGELGPKRNVVWIASEDSAAIDIGPRLLAAGADLERVLIVSRGWIQLPRDLGEINRVIVEMGDVGLAIIDPLSNHIAGKNTDSEEIRGAIGPLNQLADEHQCMVAGVRHLSEKECKNGLLAAILGSSAWVQVPRAVLAVVQDDEDPQLRHVQCVTGNRLPPGTPGRIFRIDGVLLDGFKNEVTRATWEGASHKDLDTLLANKKNPSKGENARDLILDILEDEGEQESDALDARIAGETGLSAKTVRNIRSELSKAGLVKPIPNKDEYGTIICWKVSRSGAPRT